MNAIGERVPLARNAVLALAIFVVAIHFATNLFTPYRVHRDGEAIGFGLLTKFSAVFFGAATFLALLASPQRRWLLTPERTRWPRAYPLAFMHVYCIILHCIATSGLLSAARIRIDARYGGASNYWAILFTARTSWTPRAPRKSPEDQFPNIASLGEFVSNKSERQRAIIQLVSARAIASQRELERILRKAGWAVTQATLSRDLRELGIVRAQGEDGARYMPGDQLAGQNKPRLLTLLPELFSGMDGVGELLVLRTLPSGAQPIAEAIDDQRWPEILGTIGGENTVLIICRSPSARDTVMERLRKIAERA